MITGERFPFFNPGFDGVVVVRDVMVKDTRHLGYVLTANFEVEESNTTEHPPGWLGSWVLRVSDPIAGIMLLEWLEACGKRPAYLVIQTIRRLLDEAVTKKGARLRLRTEQRETKGGAQWTQYTFERLLRTA